MYCYERLRDLREDADLTQKEVGTILNTTQQQYAKYELGVQEIPTHHLIRLAEYYDVSIDYIVGRLDWEDVQLLRVFQHWKPEQKAKIIKNRRKNTLRKTLQGVLSYQHFCPDHLSAAYRGAAVFVIPTIYQPHIGERTLF